MIEGVLEIGVQSLRFGSEKDVDNQRVEVVSCRLNTISE